MPAIYTRSGLADAALKAAAEAVHRAVRPESHWDLRLGWATGATVAQPAVEVQCAVPMPAGEGWVQTPEDSAGWAVRQDILLGF